MRQRYGSLAVMADAVASAFIAKSSLAAADPTVAMAEPVAMSSRLRMHSSRPCWISAITKSARPVAASTEWAAIVMGVAARTLSLKFRWERSFATPGPARLIGDLDKAGDRVVLAAGGRGGKGNAHFVSSTNRSPRFAQPGEPGEDRELEIELRLLADVGIIGVPNAGKSTLISVISAVRPKIADYPFTTLVPNLGVVSYDEGKSFVVADIPGLIEGAHQGHGLGDKFLRHVTRTSVLIHLLDASTIDPRNPLADWSTINRELALFDDELGTKPQIVVANKIDIPEARENAMVLEKNLPDSYRPLYLISAVTGEGVRALVQKVGMQLERAKRVKEEEAGDAAGS